MGGGHPASTRVGKPCFPARSPPVRIRRMRTQYLGGGEGLPNGCSAVAYSVLSVGLSIVTGEQRNEATGRKGANGAQRCARNQCKCYNNRHINSYQRQRNRVWRTWGLGGPPCGPNVAFFEGYDPRTSGWGPPSNLRMPSTPQTSLLAV